MLGIDDKRQINNLLQTNGLGKLDDPALVAQIGFLVAMSIQDHDSFRELLNKCAPKERLAMYEAMRSYLRFELKPLDVYVAELGQIAEAKQLPVIAEDGKLLPFKPVEVRTQNEKLEDAHCQPGETALAQSLIADAAATRHLALQCMSCGYGQAFWGWTRGTAVEAARAAGWRLVKRIQKDEMAEACPSCIERYWPSAKS